MRIIAVLLSILLLVLSTHLRAEDSENPAYNFMSQSWGGESIRGYDSTLDIDRFFHSIGTVLTEKVRLAPNIHRPAFQNEVRTYWYDGMAIVVYVAHFDGTTKPIAADIVITSPRWKVKDNLGIGTTKATIESLLGKSMKANSDREWTFGDGPSEVTYTFDRNYKAISIHWHSMID